MKQTVGFLMSVAHGLPSIRRKRAGDQLAWHPGGRPGRSRSAKVKYPDQIDRIAGLKIPRVIGNIDAAIVDYRQSFQSTARFCAGRRRMVG